VGAAEKSFRKAFERLKQGNAERLPKNAPVSQNNVAKEAGCDPSALRKTRYPSLVSEIQRWVEEHAPKTPPSQRQSIIAKRSHNRDFKARIKELKVQRDHLASLLVEADTKIFELTLENERLQQLSPRENVTQPLDRSLKNDGYRDKSS